MNAQQLLTDASGTQYEESHVKALFDRVCEWQRSIDPEWQWKESISYEFQYTTCEEINAIKFAVEFYVGGKTDVYITPTKHDGIIVSLVNQGYYKNIGA